MQRVDRKAAVAAYKERKIVAGIYAVRCVPTGQRWLGKAVELSRVQNGLWAGLRMGTSYFKTLQAAWNEHGEAAFVLEEIERFPDDVEPIARPRVLKERLEHWRDELGAEVLPS
jgi:hypothetical protein